MEIKKRKKQSHNNRKGFTLLEVCIAMAVLAIALLGVTSMQINAVRNVTVGNLYSQANTIANKHLEFLKTQDLTILDGWDGITDTEVSATTVPDPKLTPEIFTLRTDIQSPDDPSPPDILANAKFCRWIEVTVSWRRSSATDGTRRSITVCGLSRGEGI